jgi:hypothetical protein
MKGSPVFAGCQAQFGASLVNNLSTALLRRDRISNSGPHKIL